MAFSPPWTNAAADASDFWDFLDPIDDAADRIWDPLRQVPPINGVMVVATNAGEHGLVWMGIALAQAGFRWANGDQEAAKRHLIRFFAAITAESIAVNGVLKSLTRRARPNNGEDRPDGVRMPISSSMPSGHATSAMMSAVLLADGVDSAPARASIYAGAATVALSRHHVRIHHFTDVSAGALLGTAIGWTIRRKFRIR